MMKLLQGILTSRHIFISADARMDTFTEDKQNGYH